MVSFLAAPPHSARGRKLFPPRDLLEHSNESSLVCSASLQELRQELAQQGDAHVDARTYRSDDRGEFSFLHVQVIIIIIINCYSLRFHSIACKLFIPVPLS